MKKNLKLIFVINFGMNYKINFPIAQGEARMRIGVLGVNHKLADLKLREQLAKICEEKIAVFNLFQRTHHSFVLLSTCNRTEVYFCSSDLAAAHSYILTLLRLAEGEGEFDQKLYSFFGVDCFSHLARVTVGLDSAIIGETEIQNQVKLAYEKACEADLPHDLHFLFQKALGIAKKVRTTLQLGRGIPHLEQAIIQTGRHFFRGRQSPPRLLFVGCSEINLKIIRFFKGKEFKEITLCNRSLEKAKEVAALYQIDLLRWEDLPRWSRYDWVILATKAPHYLIQANTLEGMGVNEAKLIMDLSVPRNVEPEAALEKGITLMNIDQINRLLGVRQSKMNQDLAEAEEKILKAAREQAARFLLKNESKFICMSGTA